MSKSKGNIYYLETLLGQGYEIQEIRFFLIYGHYRQRLNYSDTNMRSEVDKLRRFRETVKDIEKRKGKRANISGRIAQRLKQTFVDNMDGDLNAGGAFDELHKALSKIKIETLDSREAFEIIKVLHEIDGVLKIIF